SSVELSNGSDQQRACREGEGLPRANVIHPLRTSSAVLNESFTGGRVPSEAARCSVDFCGRTCRDSFTEGY
ncbi:hypothetical protein SKAU_G00300040, partial [Synaphobranchus kaupii]